MCAYFGYARRQGIPILCERPCLQGAVIWLHVGSQLKHVHAHPVSVHSRGLGRGFKSSHGLLVYSSLIATECYACGWHGMCI